MKTEPGTRATTARFRDERSADRFRAAYAEALTLWPSPRRTLDIATDFGTTRVVHHGPDTGEPVVLLHGSDANSSVWYPQVAAFAERHPVYAIDTIDDPGGSVQTAPVTGSADAAAWLGQVVAGLALDRVHLVGHSYGGWLALNQAAHAPERLATVTVLDPGGLEKVRPAFYATVVGGALATLLPRRARPWAARVLANSAVVADPRLTAPLMIAARSFGPRRTAARPFTDDELRSIRVPLLVLLGARSTLMHVDRAQGRVRALVADAAAETVPGTGHGLAMEKPEYVNARVLEFAATVRD